ncbi:MAG: peroxiredoxin [Flaviflexus sp.]|nr:peroxiredoxin [Flaviflexus sp.]
MTRLQPGDPAPSFTLSTPNGEVSLAKELAGAERGVIVYFYPKAGTPGCTKEACDFRDASELAGYTVIGISPDSIDKLRTFTDEQSLDFILASDPDHAVMAAYGAWGEKKNYGKTYLGVIRSTVVIDPDGRVSQALYNVKATGHVARLERQLG